MSWDASAMPSSLPLSLLHHGLVLASLVLAHTTQVQQPDEAGGSRAPRLSGRSRGPQRR